MTDRPAIPDPMKRAVRQRCGFGCVICGAPLYQYDHMVEYSVVGAHEEENITLLCPSHHDDKTHKRLPLGKVQDFNAKPFNLGRGMTSAYPLACFYGESFAFWLGTNYIETPMHGGFAEGAALLVDDGPVLGARVQENEVLLRAAIRDRDNRPILTIRDNELTHATGVWDITFEANRLKMRSAAGQIDLEILFHEGALQVARGDIYANGLKFSIREDGRLNIRGFNIASSKIQGGGMWAGVLQHPGRRAMGFGDARRFLYEEPPPAFGLRF